MLARTARLAALSLPLVLACVLAFAGLRVHDGRVERPSHLALTSGSPLAAPTPDAPGVGQAFGHELTMSVPWPAFAALLVLCLLPAVASLVAWSGARRGRQPAPAGRAW